MFQLQHRDGETSKGSSFPDYLTKHHGGKNSLEVGQVMVAELRYDAGVQQHELQRASIGSDTDHHRVPQVCEGGFTTGPLRDASTDSGPGTLDQNVPGMEIPMDKVILKNLQHR